MPSGVKGIAEKVGTSEMLPAADAAAGAAPEGGPDEGFDQGVAQDVQSDRLALARGAGILGVQLDSYERTLAASMRADSAGCVPLAARRVIAMLCTLFTTFINLRVETGARRARGLTTPARHAGADMPPGARSSRAAPRRRAEVAGYEGWFAWNVTARQLMEYLRNGAGRWRSIRYDVVWDAWYPGNVLVTSLVHIALLPFRFLLADYRDEWMSSLRGLNERQARAAKLIAARNDCYAWAVDECVGEGDPEDVASEMGDPYQRVRELAADFASELGYLDFRELDDAQVASAVRNNQNAALRDRGLIGQPAPGRCLYVAPKLTSMDLLRRTLYALGWRTMPVGPLRGHPEYVVWRAQWDDLVVPMATRIATALVLHEGRRAILLLGISDRPHNLASGRWGRIRADLRAELDGVARAVSEGRQPYIADGYFRRMWLRGEMMPEEPAGAADAQ